MVKENAKDSLVVVNLNAENAPAHLSNILFREIKLK